jgi:anti-anti-sigma regulatory factor
MLRIRAIAGEGEVARLLVEGRLTRQTVGELERECDSYLSRSGAVWLDLSQLTFADEAGVIALRRLAQKGALLSECSAFLSWLLDDREEKRNE